MSAIIGPNSNPGFAAIVGQAHSERATNWAQLTDEYKEVAFNLHRMALGEIAKSHQSLGPIYVRQALNMQRNGYRLVTGT